MLANIVWPSLYLANRTLTPAIVVISLIVEWLTLRHVAKTKSPWFTAAVIVAINLISATVGYFVITELGFYWELGPGSDIANWQNAGTFNPVSWTVAIFLAIAINTFLEAGTAALVFRIRSSRAVIGLLLANSLTVILAYLTLAVSPRH